MPKYHQNLIRIQNYLKLISEDHVNPSKYVFLMNSQKILRYKISIKSSCKKKKSSCKIILTLSYKLFLKMAESITNYDKLLSIY